MWDVARNKGPWCGTDVNKSLSFAPALWPLLPRRVQDGAGTETTVTVFGRHATKIGRPELTGVGEVIACPVSGELDEEPWSTFPPLRSPPTARLSARHGNGSNPRAFLH